MLYLCAGPAPQFPDHAGSWVFRVSCEDGDSTLFIADGGRGAVAASFFRSFSFRVTSDHRQSQVVALPSATASRHDVVGASVRAEACSRSILLRVEARLVAAWCIDV